MRSHDPGRPLSDQERPNLEELTSRLRSSSDSQDKVLAARQLAKLGDPGAVEPLIGRLGDVDDAVRVAAAEALGKLADARAAEALVAAQDDPAERVRKAATAALEALDKRLWQFADESERLLYQSTDGKVIRARLLDGTLPLTSLCRRGRSGEFKPISESIANAVDEVKVLYYPIRYHVERGAIMAGAIGALLALIPGTLIGARLLDTPVWGVVILYVVWAIALLLVRQLFIVAIVGWIVILIDRLVNLPLPSAWYSGLEFGLLALLYGILSLAAGALLSSPIGATIGAVVGRVRLPHLTRLPQA